MARLIAGTPIPCMDFESLIGQGIACIGRGDHTGALRCFDAIAAIQPAHLGALQGRGLALTSLNRFDEAADCFAAALLIAPDNRHALFGRGFALAKLQRFVEAAPCFVRILAVEPDHFDALLCLGIALRSLHRYREAELCLARVLQLDGEHLAALLNRGLALGNLERHREALECFERILSIDPRHAKAMLNRSVALGRLELHEEALTCAEQAVLLDPDDAGVHAQKGFELASLNRHEEALPCLEQARAIDPDHADALEHRGFVCLALGMLGEGFRARESRWRVPPLKGTGLNTTAPLWLGDADLAGCRILLQHEQGFGDTLQFVRYAPLLAQRGAEVILRVPAALASLLAGIPGVARVVAEPALAPAHDCYCPMMSLPLAFGTDMDSIPASVPYLQAEPALIAGWRRRFDAAARRPRIGVAWAGRQYGRISSPRDMPLRALLPLFELDADFVCLQKEIPAADRALLDSLPRLLRFGETLRDFADTAALIDALDLVIAVDTAVVHLAGALGRPVWIMNRFASCWRWLRHRPDSPWYPGARLFRQSAAGDWEDVVARVRRAALQELPVHPTAVRAAPVF